MDGLGIWKKEVQFGIVSTDFTMIRPGSMHKANGGYLVLPVLDLFRYPLAWDGLKSALKTGKVAIEEPAEKMGFIGRGEGIMARAVVLLQKD